MFYKDTVYILAEFITFLWRGSFYCGMLLAHYDRSCHLYSTCYCIYAQHQQNWTISGFLRFPLLQKMKADFRSRDLNFRPRGLNFREVHLLFSFQIPWANPTAFEFTTPALYVCRRLESSFCFQNALDTCGVVIFFRSGVAHNSKL
jgi:hypothetical protein